MHPELLGRMVNLEHTARLREAALVAATRDDGAEDDGHSTGRVGWVARLLGFRAAPARRAAIASTDTIRISTSSAAVAAR